ncbi:hypothetical protein KAU11_10240 [Candidatus Babeliales bacterium]|nr:hypothetical protein [Candidatus Babeliales bacterium]
MSDVARQQGVGVKDITGYKSGDPNLIYPGETLQVGAAPKTPEVARVDALKQELAPTVTPEPIAPPSAIAEPRADIAQPEIFQGVYESPDVYKTDVQTLSTQRDDAYTRLKDFRTTRYNEELSTRQVNKSKDDIKAKDAEIEDLRRQRDEATGVFERGAIKGVSAATIAGRVGLAKEQFNTQIGNLVNERNRLAEDYNLEIGDIKDTVEREAKDISSEYDYYDAEVAKAEAAQKEYRTALVRELEGRRAREEKLTDADRSLEDKLTEIRLRESVKGGGVGTGDTDEVDYSDVVQSIAASAGGKTPLSAFVNQMNKSKSVLSGLVTLTDQINSLDTGPVLGILRSNDPYDVKAQYIKNILTTIVPNLARGVYGEVGVLTDNDIKLYMATLPNLKSTSDVNRMVLAMTLNTVLNGMGELLKTNANAQYDVSRFEADYVKTKDMVDGMLSQVGAEDVAGRFETQEEKPWYQRGVLGNIFGGGEETQAYDQLNQKYGGPMDALKDSQRSKYNY